MNMTLSEELKWRGFVNQTTYKDPKELDSKHVSFYWGVDPSAPSMTIGNLAAAMMVRHFIKHGHNAVLLVGGATGLIGDPDGKAQERDLITPAQLANNKKGIVSQYKTIFAGQKFNIVDNFDWFKDIGYLEFLRDVGKHVPMRQMLARDFVEKRLSDKGAGISYAEFSYVLIQAYDFLKLSQSKHEVTLQVCGSDQWGNSIAGVDLIRRTTGKETHVWSAPLVINKVTGKKFGKTEDGAIWLDSKLTSVYKFYQFWLNVNDDGVEDYLKIYTLLNKSEIDSIMSEFNSNKGGRLAQKRLAEEITTIVHGKTQANTVKRVTEILFGDKPYSELTKNDLLSIEPELPTAQVKIGDDMTSALVASGLAGSSSEARRFIDQNAVYLNGTTIKSDTKLTKENLLIGKYAILRRGKNNNALLKIS